MAKLPTQLQQAAEQVHTTGKPKMVRVKDLLSWYGAQRRGVLVVQMVRAGLRRANLVTVPDFEVAYIDQRVKLKAPDPPKARTSESAEAKPVEVPVIVEPAANTVVGGSLTDPAPRIGMLKAANTTPLTVTRETEVVEAISKMLLHDYSQLPVTHGEKTVHGMISWKSIGRAKVKSSNTCKYVKDCMEQAELVYSDTHLFDAISRIAARDVVLVRNTDNKLAGLVTTYDISLQFSALSEPFLLLSEIENHIRRLIDGKFSLEQLKAAKDPSDTVRKVENVANLTFGEYIRLLDYPDNWSRLGYELSRVEFTKRLREVGRIRNDVMHFHPDGISEGDLELLRDTRKFLQALR
jgi:CBS domain-containing protein